MHSADLLGDSPVGLVFRRHVHEVWRTSRSPCGAGERRVVVCATHIGVGVLRLCFGQRGVTVGAVVLTEVIGGLRVGGDQQLLDVPLSAGKKYRFVMEFHRTF